MYNAKFYKYPAGWQVRVYDTLVGYDKRPVILAERPSVKAPIWDADIEDYLYVQLLEDDYNSDTYINPFTMQEEPVPHEFDEDEYWAKKERSISSSMARTKGAVYHLARSNEWDWFITLTFNPKCVDSFDYAACVKKLSKWLNNARLSCPDMGYLVVPEKHPTSGRYHFHGLFKNCQGLGFVDSGHVDNHGNRVYNVGSYKLGFTTATVVSDQARVTRYIAKYITKDVCEVAFREETLLGIAQLMPGGSAGSDPGLSADAEARPEAQGECVLHPRVSQRRSRRYLLRTA